MEKKPIETFSKQSEIAQRDEMMEDVKTPPDLVQAVKQVSNDLTNDGEDLLLNELPKEILQLTEHIQVPISFFIYLQNEELFRLSPKELEKELFGSIEEFVETIQNSIQNAKDFVKENRKDWEKWQKRQKKERKENHHITQKKKHSHPIQIKSFPENCKVPKNTVLLIRSNKIQKLEKLIEFVNDEMVTVNRLVTSIKLWISLKIPRIEDGNNVGVVVQEEHIGLLSGMESAVATVFSNSISYYSSRGEYINNVSVF